jgi:hypothetical protein
MSDGVHHAIPDTFLKLQIFVTPHVQYLAIGDGQHVQVLWACSLFFLSPPKPGGSRGCFPHD